MKKSIRTILVLIFVLIIAISMYIATKGSYLEYKELGDKYLSIYKTNMMYNYIVMGINFLITFIIMYFANRGIKKGLKEFFDSEKKEMPKLVNKSISLVIAVVSSILVGILFTPKVILFASNVSFEKTDLIFNLDISFYMFVEPLIKMIISYIMGIFIFLIVYSIAYYIFVFNRYFDGIDKEELRKSYLVKHILNNIRIISIIYAIYTLVGTLDIVFGNFITTSSRLQLTGAGLTDVTIKLWGNIIFAIVIVGSASAFDLNSLFGDSSASEPQQISIEGINFTIPEGYTEEVNGSMDNEKLSAGSLTYTVNGKSFVNLKTQDAAAIIVADYGDYNVTDQVLQQVADEKKTIAGQEGYVKVDGGFTVFSYEVNGDLVTISASNETVIEEFLS